MKRKDTPKLPVSDHAVLRWLERHGFVNVEAAREQIYRECREALNAGASRLTVNGTEYRFSGGHVITIISHRKTSGPLKWGKKR